MSKDPATTFWENHTLRFPLNGGSVALVKLNENEIPLINFGAVSSLFRDSPMADDWRKFAAAAVNEKDSAKLRVLVEKLIEGLSEEQQRVRREIENRLEHRVRDMEKKGLDPSIP
jgi:hypothetical protein